MFADYKLQVLSAYREKKASNTLSPNLVHSTPAKLRAECLEVFDSRYLKKDETALKAFFGTRNDVTGYIQAIRKCDADKFKPLANFLKGNTTGTEDKNIELLAWLIDFEPRPYQFGQPYIIPIAAARPVVNEVHQNLSSKAKPTQQIQKKIIFLAITLAVIGGGAYLLFNHQKKTGGSPYPVNTGQEKCMYWSGDHYQPVSCSQKLRDTPIYALDTIKVAHFKRITNPDTITVNSLGKVWYIKLNGNIEYYTSGGLHPIYTERRLKPLSVYMLNKYILHK